MSNEFIKYLQLGLIKIANTMCYFIFFVSLIKIIKYKDIGFENIFFCLISIVVISGLIYIKKNIKDIYVLKT